MTGFGEPFIRLMNGSENHSLECPVLRNIRDKAFLNRGPVKSVAKDERCQSTISRRPQGISRQPIMWAIKAINKKKPAGKYGTKGRRHIRNMNNTVMEL
jgi:hypothetical protein